ncbi:uncharacterized protein EI90DRAFT_2995710 [Cantharellus anzutake]|uniref:uncharacterized protein n=1 Tax=Cantharellus anzutake TaxID=1750568 RepID=UPI00190552EE|nr:uncharacterized protein EI90DRAFT_2995710 [Cantharellus anzutake]KAF8332116.1 hypothetical protein EI90DRAFT_2995710 [Cantharellus anzutake]
MSPLFARYCFSHYCTTVTMVPSSSYASAVRFVLVVLLSRAFLALASPTPVAASGSGTIGAVDAERDETAVDRVKRELDARAPLAQLFSSCENSKQVALTFDDGPYAWSTEVSDFLTEVGGRGTFCYNGNNWACIYDAESQARVKYAVARGHQVVSHTWRHLDLTQLSFDRIHDEMWRVEQALERIVGLAPAFMRPPYGSYNNLVRQVSYQRNQSMILWDLDTGDSLGKSVSYSEQQYYDAINQNRENILALNHETYQSTVEQVLPYAIKLLQSKNYQLVTVAECLNMAPYQWTTTPQMPSSSWTC